MEIEQQRNTPKIQVLIRKRPLTKKEHKKKLKDIIDVKNHEVIVNELRKRLDMSKYIEQHVFTFDRAFSEKVTNEELYFDTIQPLIDFSMEGGKVSCFAYG